jgi:hypothetical protein
MIVIEEIICGFFFAGRKLFVGGVSWETTEGNNTLLF